MKTLSILVLGLISTALSATDHDPETAVQSPPVNDVRIESWAESDLQVLKDKGVLRKNSAGHCFLEFRALEGFRRIQNEDMDLSVPVIRVKGVRVLCDDPFVLYTGN